MNFSGKEGQPNIQRSTRPGVEPGISGLGGRDLTTAPTLPLEQYIPTENLGEDGTPIHCRLLSLADDWYSSFTQLRELVQCSKVSSLLKDVWGLVSKSRPLDCEADTMTSAPPQTLMYQLVMWWVCYHYTTAIAMLATQLCCAVLMRTRVFPGSFCL